MTDMKDEHNRANTRWVLEPAGAKAGLYRQTLIRVVRKVEKFEK